MDTIVIETLIKTTKERITVIDSYKQNWDGIKGAEEQIDKCNSKIELYQKCIDQLQKLKEFDLSEENIEDMVPGGNMDEGQVYSQYMKGYRDGLYAMYELIKKQLS